MKLAYILPSKTKEKVPQMLKTFAKELDFDTFFLCSTDKDKILKKDIDLNFDLLQDYDIICPVGADSLKYTCGLTGITKYNGQIVDEKYFPIMDPNIISVKPQAKDDIDKAFKTLINIVSGEIPKTYDKDHRHIDTVEEFSQYLEKMKAVDNIVCDIETTSLSSRNGLIIGVAFSTKAHEGVFVDSDVIEEFMEVLQEEIFNKKKIIFHNAKFDMAFLGDEFGFTFPNYEDTILMHYVLDESVGSHGLKQLAMKFTDLGDYDRELNEYKKKFCRAKKIKLEDFNYGMIPIEILAPYACKDGDATMQLFNKFYPLIQNNEQFRFVYENILKPATVALMYLEQTGGPVSLEYLEKLEHDYNIDIEECINEINLNPAILEFERTTGKVFNPNSVYHLREIFFNILGLKSLKKTETGADSTDAEVLEALEHPLADAVLDLRKKVKLTRTYIKNIKDNLDKDGRLRSNFNIIGTAAGRLSSSGALNYQNLPRDKDAGIKHMFRANPGYTIVQADLGTAEVYVAAVLSNDQFFQNAFIEGLDFHSYVAKNMFKLPCEISEVAEKFPNERQAAKAITFGIMYGAGPSKISSEAGVSFEEAKRFISLYFSQAKDLKDWIEENLNFIRIKSFTYSLFGRKRRLPEAQASSKGVAMHAERSGLNFLIQSVASDINLLGLIDMVSWIKENNLQDKVKIFSTVHDSIVAEVKEEFLDEYCNKLLEFLQKDRGASIPNCPIKVDFEVGPSWGEVKKYKGFIK